MAHQKGIITGICIVAASFALYSFGQSFSDRIKTEDVLDEYRSYNNEAEILRARNILSQLQTRQEELNSLRELCLTDVPEDERGTKIYQVQYCTNRSIKAMGFDYKLSELQKKAYLPLPSDVNKTTCKASVPSTTFFATYVKKESPKDDGKTHAEKFNQAVSNATSEDTADNTL